MAEEQPAKKARKEFSASFDFCSAEAVDEALAWNNPPASATFEQGTGLRVIPKPGTDYWRKTFSDPPADRATGHGLLYTIPAETQQCTAITEFTLKESVQYDQAGVMVHIDDTHWLKAGIEYENGVPNMSCVVTNGESDWNYRAWPMAEGVKVRVTLTLYPGVCECKVEHWNPDGVDGGTWDYLRGAPLMAGPDGVKVGPMCCAPKKTAESGESMEAIFKSFEIKGE